MNKQPNRPISNLAIASIIEVDGTHVIAELDHGISELTRVYGGIIYPIGQFGSVVKIHYGSKLIFGYVGRLRMKSEYEREQGMSLESSGDARIIEMDLFGEGEWISHKGKWELRFERGISTFPLPQQKVYLTPRSELPSIYGLEAESSITLGEHVGTGGTPCKADLNELLGKHTAILGSTGSGKSGTVAALLHSILDMGKAAPNWHPQIIVLDPHNEYGKAFPDHGRLCTDEGSLELPHWLLNLEETVGLLIGKTGSAATSQANIVKTALWLARKESAEKLGIKSDTLNVDSPIPYQLNNFIEHIRTNTNMPPQASKQDSWNSILHKIETLRNDSRLMFMMKEWGGNIKSDPLPKIMKQFLDYGHSIRIIDLSGVPNEVAGITSSAIARMLFSIKLWQSREEREASPVLLVCEEAHRYVPDRGEAQYEAAQEAIRRLAKEGRKYGIGLMLVSQRPGEVEATVLSQCNSWIIMRTTNNSDRQHVQGMLPDSLSGLTKVLSGLRRREAIFVGQAAVLPSRILIRDLVEAGKPLPRSQDIDFFGGWKTPPGNEDVLEKVAKRWRLQKRDA